MINNVTAAAELVVLVQVVSIIINSFIHVIAIIVIIATDMADMAVTLQRNFYQNIPIKLNYVSQSPVCYSRHTRWQSCPNIFIYSA